MLRGEHAMVMSPTIGGEERSMQSSERKASFESAIKWEENQVAEFQGSA
jgi:hypothetical protein